MNHHEIRHLLDEALLLRSSSIEPGRDLWPGIQERIAALSDQVPVHLRASAANAPAIEPAGAASGGRVGDSSPPAPRKSWFAPLQAWWAGPRRSPIPLIWSAAVVVIGITLYGYLSQQEKPPAASPAMAKSLTDLESVTAKARGDVSTLFASRGGELPGAAVSEFEKNLQLLDQAIRDSRMALEADPQNTSRQRMLLAVYQKELGLLRWATRLLEQS